MKLFLISNMYPSADSPGYGVFVRNMAEELEDNDIKVIRKAVICGRPKSKWNKICNYFRLYAGIMKGFFTSYDFIYIHFPNHIVPLLSVLYKFRQPKIFVNFHGEDLLYAKKGFHNWIGKATEKFCRKYATGIVVPSEYFAGIVKDRQLVTPDKIIVSPSGGVNEKVFCKNEDGGVESSISHPLRIGYVGRLEPGKGILEFLSVAKHLNEIGFDYKATIIGYGTLTERTKKIIEENAMSDKVEMIPGVEQSKLPEYYRNFDLLLFLSTRPEESLGLTGIESMACGTPVVGSSVGGIASYLENHKNGFMIENVNDSDKITEVIRSYAESSNEFRSKMRENAVATGTRYYSSKVGSKLAADLSAVLEESK